MSPLGDPSLSSGWEDSQPISTGPSWVCDPLLLYCPSGCCPETSLASLWGPSGLSPTLGLVGFHEGSQKRRERCPCAVPPTRHLLEGAPGPLSAFGFCTFSDLISNELPFNMCREFCWAFIFFHNYVFSLMDQSLIKYCSASFKQ